MMPAPPPAPPKLALRDIHLPPDPPWWPPAPGWWLLAVLLLVLLGVAAVLARRWRRQRTAARRVLAEVDRLAARHAQDDGELAMDLHQLLRRVARRYDARAARQRGEAWRGTLARVPVSAATIDRLMTLEQRMYHPQAAFDRAAVLAAAREWLAVAWRKPPRKEAPDHA